MPRTAPTLIAASATVLYVLWAAPAYGLFDTAELSWVASTLGVAHPPGHPAYPPLGKLFTLLPLGSVAFRTNLLSALCAGIAVWLVGAVAVALAELLAVGRARQIVATAASAAFAVCAPLINQATRSEVYSPALAIALASLLCALQAVRAEASVARAVRSTAAAALCAAIAVMIHPAVGLSVAVMGLVFFVGLRPKLLLQTRILAAAIAAACLGAVLLSWIVVRCRPGVPCWTDPVGFAELLRYARGAQYAANAQHGLDALRTVGAAFAYAVRATGWAAFGLIVLALLAEVVRRAAPAEGRRRLRIVASSLVAALLPFGFLTAQAFHSDNPDTQGYLLPQIALAFAAGCACGGATLERLGRGGHAVTTLALSSVVILTLVGNGGLQFRRDRYWLPMTIVDRALEEVAPRSLVMASGDHLYFGATYEQLVEGARPDVGIMVRGQMTNEHHWRDAKRRIRILDLRRARPRPMPDPLDAWAGAALDQVRGRIPRFSQSSLLEPSSARSVGILFALDGGSEWSAPVSVIRELARRRDEYRDGGDRVIRAWRLERAWGREGHGDIARAIEELRAAAWTDPGLARSLRNVRIETPARDRLLTPLVEEGWMSEPFTIRLMLAEMLYRGWRTDLAVKVLERDFRAGNTQSALVFAEILLRDGKIDDADDVYRAAAEANPAHRAWARVGLALVRGARGDATGSRRELERLARTADPRLRRWCELARLVLLPALLAPGEGS